jgi:hypothetical protein
MFFVQSGRVRDIAGNRSIEMMKTQPPALRQAKITRLISSANWQRGS